MLTCPSFTRFHFRWCPTVLSLSIASAAKTLVTPPILTPSFTPQLGRDDVSPLPGTRKIGAPQPGQLPTTTTGRQPHCKSVEHRQPTNNWHSSNVVEQIAEKQAAARQLVVVPTRIDGRDGRGLVLATQSPCSTTIRSKQLTTLPPVPTSDPCQVSVRSFAPLARTVELNVAL